MRELFVASEGQPAKYPRYYRQSLEKLDREQRILSHREKGSNGYYQQNGIKPLKSVDYSLVMKYAKQLKVESIVKHYLEALL